MNIYEIFEILDLDIEGMEQVKVAYENKDYDLALEELRNYYVNRKSVSGFIDNLEDIRIYSENNFKDDIDEVIEIGNQVCENKFLFQQKWEMERTEEMVQFKGEIDWDFKPYSDNEWTYMINRHRFLVVLAQSYVFTKEEKYIKCFNSIVSYWIDNNPINDEKRKTSWRTIEAGIRCKNWTKALEILLKEDKVEKEILAKMLISLDEHIRFLKEKNLKKRRMSNWVILEQQGSFVAQVYFKEIKVSKECLEDAMETLEDAAFTQVMEDGLHWEQSFQYHNEMLNCYLDVITVGNRNNIKFTDMFYAKIRAMAYATIYIIKPNNCQSNYGDSDEEDLRGPITLSTMVFQDGILKNKAYLKGDFDSLFCYGIAGVDKLNSIDVIGIKEKSKAFVDNGIYVSRNGFKEGDGYSLFKCGFLGSGHGHSDMLHLEISNKGEDVLVDSGRYNYCDEEPLRLELKKPQSHNTTTVDDIDFTVCVDSWSNKGVATPVKGRYKFTDEYDFIEGGHLGYMNKGLFVNRKVINIKPDIYVVCDEFIGEGEHSYKQYWNFNKDYAEIVDRNKVLYRGEKSNFLMQTLEEQEGGEFILESNVISKSYNRKYESKRAVYKTRGVGDKFLTTVCISLDKDEELKPQVAIKEVYNSEGKKIDRSFVEAIEIKLNSGETYIVVVVHKEEDKGRKLYKINETQFYGSVVVIKEGGKLEKTILAY